MGMAAPKKPRGRKAQTDPNALRVSGDALFDARGRAKLNQFELAFHSGTSPSLVSRLESEATAPDITLSTLGRIAKALAIEPGKLLTTEPRPKQRTSRR